MLLSLDGTLVVQLINFVIFLVVLDRIFLKPVGAAIAKRRAYIDGIASDIERFETDVKALRAQASEVRSAARREADAHFAELRAAAQAEGNAIIADHQVQAAALTDEAQATVALEAATARSREPELVEALARTMLERAVGPEILA
jgi:F-type H+-transporting ATPase subunit b